MIQIKSRFTGAVLWESEHATLKLSLSAAVESGACLRGADLRGADLSGAYLRSADLSGADLRSAYLIGACLSGADFRSAYLSGAKNFNVYSAGFDFRVCPPSGEFEAWKSASDGAIVKLKIPRWARRVSSVVGRKCRAEFAIVLSIEDRNGKPLESATSRHDSGFTYRVGKIIKPDSYDDSALVECSNGIHFFITRKEAVEW